MLRAMAMLWMAAYHLCFDLNHFRLIEQDFYRDPFWTWQRTAIVSLFLFTAGLSQAVALHQGQSWPRFWRRWLQVAGAALLVTAGSVAMFPESFIHFGVLHGIAVMLIVARLTVDWGAWLWLAGGFALALMWAGPWMIGVWPALEVLNTPWLNWLGLISQKPITEDYVPLLPWLGVMWWGVAAGQWAMLHRPQWLGNPAGTTGESGRSIHRSLVHLGRWSLSFYLVHQPVLIGLTLLWTYISRAG